MRNIDNSVCRVRQHVASSMYGITAARGLRLTALFLWTAKTRQESQQPGTREGPELQGQLHGPG